MMKRLTLLALCLFEAIPFAMATSQSIPNEPMAPISHVLELKEQARTISRKKARSKGPKVFFTGGKVKLYPFEYTRSDTPGDGPYYNKADGEFDCSSDSDSVVFHRIPCLINGNAITIQPFQPVRGGYSHSVFEFSTWAAYPKTVSFDITAPALAIPGANIPFLVFGTSHGLIYSTLIEGATTQHITLEIPQSPGDDGVILQVGQRVDAYQCNSPGADPEHDPGHDYCNDPDNSPVSPVPAYTISNIVWDYREVKPKDGNNASGCPYKPDGKDTCPSVSNPVNVSTGAMWHSTNDFYLQGRTAATSLIMNRSYTAFPAAFVGDLGPNWRHPYESSLDLSDPAEVTWIDENGGPWTFHLVSGTYVSPPGFVPKLFGFSDHYELRKKDHSVLSFDLSGNLQKITDRHGEAITLTYDSNGKLATISAPIAGTLTVTRNSLGYIAGITRSRDNLTYTYDYDDSGRLSQVTDFAGLKYKYTYNTSQPGTTAQGMLATMTDPLNRVTRFTYYDDGKAKQQFESGGGVSTFSYTPATGNPTSTTFQDIDGTTTVYHFDGQFQAIQKDRSDGSQTFNGIVAGFLASFQDELGFVTSYGHDANGNRNSIQRAADPAPTLITYDQTFDVPISVTPPTGAPTSYSLDPSTGDVMQVTRTAGSASLSLTYTRDAFGNLLSTNNGRATYSDVRNSDGLLTTVFDSHNPETRTYDSRSRLSTRTFLSGRVLTYTYDNYDRVTQVSDSAGPTISSTYDAMGRLLSKTVSDGHKPQTTHYVWDENDRLASQTDALGRQTTYTYDTTRILKDPVSIKDSAGRVTSFTYDAMGRRATKTEPNGAVTHFAYNLRGDLISVTDVNGNVTTYEYDGNGRKTAEIRPSMQGTTAVQQKTRYVYDGAGNLTQVVHESTSGLPNRAEVYEYDAFDRLIKKTLLNDGSLNEANFTYEPQLDSDLFKTVNNEVANLGFTQEAAPPYALTSFSQSAAQSGNPLQLIEDQFTVDRDVTGEIAGVTGTISGHVYSKSYDPAGRLINADAGPLRTAIQYDGFGRKVALAHSTGEAESVAYDSLNRITGLKWKEGTKSSVEEYLRYDLAGNITDIARENARYQLGYDEADQLITSKMKGVAGVPDYNRQFGYDLVGNRVNDSVNGTSDNFVSNFLQHTNTTNYEADPYGFGEVAKEISANQVKNYQYRADGKIAGFQNSTTQANYFYDGLDRLAAKALNVNGTQFTQSYVNLADENRVLLGKAGDGSVTAYIDGQEQLEHLGEVKGGAGKGYITDHLGSVLNSPLAGFGKVYGLYGETSLSSSISQASPAKEYGFAGYSYNREMGTYGTDSRQYNPTIGRWMSQDSIGLKGGMNLYGYVGNKPTLLTDPSGNGPLSGVACNLARVAATRTQFANNFNKYKTALDEINETIESLNKQSSCLGAADSLRFAYERQINDLEHSKTMLTAQYFASVTALASLDIIAKAACVAVAIDPFTP